MSMDKSEIIKMVLELYSARKEAKEYLDFYAEPNEGQKLEEYKHIIREEFHPSRNREPKTRFSVPQGIVRLQETEAFGRFYSRIDGVLYGERLSVHFITMETCGSNFMILLRVISTRHCATSCYMTFGTSMIPESSNALCWQALVDGDFLTH